MKELFKLSNQKQIIDDKYTSNISLPQYEIKGDNPHIEELVLTTKVGKLISNIKNSYVKSFYSVMSCPSAVKINMMGDTHYRIHHHVVWNNVVPKIVSGRYKKK